MIKTLQKYSIVQCRVENVSKTGLLWRNSAICGEIRAFLWRKRQNKTKRDAKNSRLYGELCVVLHSTHTLWGSLGVVGTLTGTLFEFHLAEAEGHTD